MNKAEKIAFKARLEAELSERIAAGENGLAAMDDIEWRESELLALHRLRLACEFPVEGGFVLRIQG